MDFSKVFHNLRLNNLDKKWIKDMWNAQFFTCIEPPKDDYFLFIMSENMTLLLDKVYETIKNWLNMRNEKYYTTETPQISWQTLVDSNININALLPVLYYIMKNGQYDYVNESSKKSCFSATSLYFMLLAIPGSHAFNVFHPNIYKRAVETLYLFKCLVPNVKKNNMEMDLNGMSDTEDLLDHHVLSQSEKISLMNHLNIVLCDFIAMIKLFSLKTHPESLDISIFTLLEITKFAIDNSQLKVLSRNQNMFCYNTYVALHELCNNKHGPVNATIMLIAKYTYPRFLYDHSDFQIKYTHNIMIDFLQELMEYHGRDAQSAIVTLIQYLMTKCPVRLEARQKQVAALLKLIMACKEDIVVWCISDVISLSQNTKILCRLYAQEIIGKFLVESYPKSCDSTASMRWTKIRKILFATVLSRCNDSSNLVRSRAMTTIADFAEIRNNMKDLLEEDILNNSNSNEMLPSLDELRIALLEDSNLLINLSSVLPILADRMEDERAFIRRSALQIVQNLSITYPVLVTKVAPMISRRCRDPSMIVRCFAIQALSNILEYFSSNSEILNEWVQAVLPQMFDVEIKVQEKALESFHRLLINKIISASNCKDLITDDSLPWRITNKLTELKMMKHLSKACKIWVQNGVIGPSVIRNIQSHIGSVNDTAAWVLLTKLSENTKLPNIGNYIGDYKKLIEKDDYLTNLVLRTLKNSWMSLSQYELKQLHEYLYQCLCQFKITFNLIGVCLDIINNITKYLYNDRKGNHRRYMESCMKELMSISEAQIQKIPKNNDENPTETDRYLRAMSMLGHSALFCSSKLSSVTLRILEGLLLEWNSLPNSIKNTELQAFTVIVLGQHALRDHEIAQEIIPILGQLLRMNISEVSSVEVAVKVNAAKALADLCVRFTALVEPYLLDMCICMKDPNSVVRETIVTIFIQLLLEDFIKIKGPFFFHILTMLFDPDKTIRELTIFLVEERLLKKNKTLIAQQFLESLYHYNNYRLRHKICNPKMQENEEEALTFPGTKHLKNRAIIYDFMLEHLDPAEKIKLLVKLTTQILGGISNGRINIQIYEGACVLKDALYILNNKRLQSFLHNSKQNIDLQDQGDSVDQSDSTISTPAINVINEGMKKHGIEVLMPTLIKIREKLIKIKSPLENDVMALISKMYVNYNKEHLTNLLNEYSHLEEEINRYVRNLAECREYRNEQMKLKVASPIESDKENVKEQTRSFVFARVPRIILHRLPPMLSKTINFRELSSNLMEQPSFSSSEELIPSTSTHKSFEDISISKNIRTTKVRRLSSPNKCQKNTTTDRITETSFESHSG